MDAVTSDQIQKLENKLSTVQRKAEEVDEVPVREVNHRYRQLVDETEALGNYAHEIGEQAVRSLDLSDEDFDTDEDKYEFFWSNELWNHQDFEGVVDSDLTQVLDTLYTFPFAYELENARGEREKVDRARYTIDAVFTRRDELDDLPV